jgi:hypothetical protein
MTVAQTRPRRAKRTAAAGVIRQRRHTSAAGLLALPHLAARQEKRALANLCRRLKPIAKKALEAGVSQDLVENVWALFTTPPRLDARRSLGIKHAIYMGLDRLQLTIVWREGSNTDNHPVEVAQRFLRECKRLAYPAPQRHTDKGGRPEESDTAWMFCVVKFMADPDYEHRLAQWRLRKLNVSLASTRRTLRRKLAEFEAQGLLPLLTGSAGNSRKPSPLQ